jgi:hypothetical protein
MHCIRCDHVTFHSDITEVDRISPTEVLLCRIRIYECANCGAVIKMILPALQVTYLLEKKGSKHV